MFKELPETVGLVFNNRTADSHWGKPEVIDALVEVGRAWQRPSISIGHISRRDGGKFHPHVTHRKGDAVDIRPMRRDGKNAPVTWRDAAYSQELTRGVIKMLRAKAPIRSILFNDPVLIAEKLCQPYPNHSDHLHVVFAEARPVLRFGSEGQEVRLLQEKLGIPIDGKFGGRTQQAVEKFQRQQGLNDDGIVGARTWEALELQ